MGVKFKMPLSMQVRRAAQAVTNGEAILSEVNRHKEAIVKSATEGDPPVSAVSSILAMKYPREMAAAPARQFVGTAVKAILIKEGFELYQSGVKLRGDPIFSTGSVYRRKDELDSGSRRELRNAYAHMVRGMTSVERRLFLDVLQTALGEENDG